MKKVSLEVYSQATNIGIVKMPGRKFPGSVIQGDSLSILLSLAESIYEKVKNSEDEDLRYDALELKEMLETRLGHYEEILAEHNHKLPYYRKKK